MTLEEIRDALKVELEKAIAEAIAAGKKVQELREALEALERGSNDSDRA